MSHKEALTRKVWDKLDEILNKSFNNGMSFSYKYLRDVVIVRLQPPWPDDEFEKIKQFTRDAVVKNRSEFEQLTSYAQFKTTRAKQMNEISNELELKK